MSVDERVQEVDGVTVIRVAEESTGRIREMVGALMDEGRRAFVLDLRDCQFLSSIDVANLIALRNELQEEGGALQVANLGERLRQIFEVFHMQRFFDLDLDRAAAIAASR